jgi:hypothetical protein
MSNQSRSSGSASLPDGKDVSQYEKCERWSNVRWAWEFLRRNKEFRAACHKYRNTPENNRPQMGERIAEEFHLKRFKNYTDSWSEKKDRLLFSRTTAWTEIPEGEDVLPINTEIRTGQFALRIDVKAMSSKREMEFVVNSVRRQIEKLMKEQNIELPKLSRNRDTGQMVLWLRMLDARSAGVPNREIYVMLEEDITKFSKKRKSVEDDPEGKIIERMRAADDMVRKDYLALAFLKRAPKE